MPNALQHRLNFFEYLSVKYLKTGLLTLFSQDSNRDCISKTIGICSTSSSICFSILDFEYFGWDDPVKLICDFAFHPGMELTLAKRKHWFEKTLKLYGDSLLSRLSASWPLYGLCWVLILLNEFRDDIWKRRCAADSTVMDSRIDLQARQLKRSGQLLKFIDNSVQTKTFDFI